MFLISSLAFSWCLMAVFTLSKKAKQMNDSAFHNSLFLEMFSPSIPYVSEPCIK
jgi:hypothetical protein